jgi:hypothetical protein
MSCCVCGEAASEDKPSEAHEIEQGLWFLSIPLCAGCHRGSHNGIHGQARIWKVKKITELSALDDTFRKVIACILESSLSQSSSSQHPPAA